MFCFILINCKEREFLKLSSLFSISCIHTLVASDFIYIVLKKKIKLEGDFMCLKICHFYSLQNYVVPKNFLKRKIKLKKKDIKVSLFSIRMHARSNGNNKWF